MAWATAIQNSAVTEIYIGGAADTRTRLVAAFAEARAAKLAHSHREAHYFPHYAPRRARHLAQRHIESGREIVLIGHSWGGDTALRVLKGLSPETIPLLVCVDPVPKSRLNPPPRPLNAEHILFIDARPTRPNQSDKVKDFGQLFCGTLHRRLECAHTAITADLNHFAFSQMMLTRAEDGLSALDRINQIGQISQRSPTASPSSAAQGPRG
ncbi:hypothetical protein [Hyphomonas pacifica]|uniref:hypothetical protein n=1 Tax=Hyphomonas pacifica TaxID=1280941 RepID=UPI000DBFB0BA|nr:hypothetical protein [Hyphomonas pacifica]RAN37102.1 hypothetical protein HY11_09955 [Hyphomonas pacifica]